jgi:hypothetical protein
MLLEEAKRLIAAEETKEPTGFMVEFEWLKNEVGSAWSAGGTVKDWFPDPTCEPVIATEEEARELADAFSVKLKGKVANVVVVDYSRKPVTSKVDVEPVKE